MKFKPAPVLILAGFIFGFFLAYLVLSGNPANMGVCAVCFTRDTAGALGFHSVKKLSYIRPEIIGFILGAFLSALLGREFKAVSGSSPLIRFLLGFFVAIGALVFLGCPVRMVARLAGGDWTALAGLLGLIVGIAIGSLFLRVGFSLGPNRTVNFSNGLVLPIVCIGLFVLVVTTSPLVLHKAKHAPWLVSILAGLAIGICAQRSRFCTIGGIRDLILFGDFHLVQAIVSLFVFALVFNILFVQFNPGQNPIAHKDYLWSFLALVLVGWGSVFMGGCPFRQMILAGQGNTDSGITVLGMLIGSAFAHNFNIAASPKGVPFDGTIAVVVGLVFLFFVGVTNQIRD
jgi:hypothetical protein